MKKLKTFIAYDKEGKRLQGYMLHHYNLEELKKLMTVDVYEKVEYVQELRYDDKTTRYEDGTFRKITEWRWDEKTIKHYINKEVK